MKEYVRIDTVGEGEVESFLADGWEIIETTKDLFDHETTRIRYHVGLSARTLLEKYKSIIDDYERFGFKDELFRKIAEENGEDITKYSSSGKTTNDKTPMYMEKYYKVIHNQIKHFYEEYTQKEIEDNFIF